MKKKGFTLIELLAVIVILAVIALIATPIIMNVINDAKKGSFKDSTYGIAHSAELYYTTTMIKTEEPNIKTFVFPDTDELQFSGDRPTSGMVRVNQNGKVSLAITNGIWCTIKKSDSDDIKISDYTIDNCTIVDSTPESCFEFSDSTITGYTCNDKTDVLIPSKIGDKAVTKIGDRAFLSKSLTSVIIPNSVTIVGDIFFANNKLTSVIIPNSVTSVGYSAFDTNQLTSVILPNKATKIRSSAFSNNKLTSVIIPNGTIYIEASTFSSNQLKNVIIPDSVKEIGNWAFIDNKLTSVIIPNSVTDIGSSVFDSNPNLVSIINKTGRAFDWGFILGKSSSTSSITGTWDGVVVTSK